MEFIKAYMDNDHYRHLLNDATGDIFGFSFENWYCTGCYEGEYIPYSFIENDKIISNASANIMKMSHNGEEKLYIQIGTVLTRESYRNRGFARSLIDKILAEYENCADGFYLFGNLSAVQFYERIGFQRLDQYRYVCRTRPSRSAVKTPFVKAGESARGHYMETLRLAAKNAAFDQLNRYSLQLFYTYDMENVYYNEQLDCFAVFEREASTLHIVSLISPCIVSLKDVLERIEEKYEQIILGFTPRKEDAYLFEAQKYDGEEDYRFFYKGTQLESISEEKLFFPIMSHS